MSEFHLFLRLIDIPLYVYTTFHLSSHLLTDGYLGCFRLLTIVNNAAGNASVTDMSLWPNFQLFWSWESILFCFSPKVLHVIQ